jgi:holo-[acyl-carrier protein] synthase
MQSIEIGVDCIDINRFDDDFLLNKNILKKIFTINEIHYCEIKNTPKIHFAGKFAAKEAIIKALSNILLDIPLNNIEILNDGQGKPYVKLLREFSENLIIKISISHTENIAMATAIVYLCEP